MRLLDRLDRKFGKFAIKNLMTYIIALNAIVFVLSKIEPLALNRLTLIPQAVLIGEFWRLITFIFIPPSTSTFFIIFVLLLYYMIGNGLESEWGTFKFNVYYFLGVIGAILSAFISGNPVTSSYLNLTLFFAFAYIYPDFQIRLMLILPVKMKYLALISALFLAYSFFTENFSGRLAIAFAIINFILFFGLDIIRSIRNNGKSMYRKKIYAAQTTRTGPYHRCHTCGVTEEDDENMEFRYRGDYEYCMKHLNSHEDDKKTNQ
jgi:hypothetical protein